ncbi:MAG: hypothetical protein IPL32_16990 [Chloracidobacterium sp.]|nr:hypothetical protein [Chloracidobacterium sp.]
MKDGNGLSPPIAKVGNVDAAATNERPKVSNSLSRRVERHGNVLAVADWIEIEEKPELVDQKETAPTADRKIFRRFALAGSAVAVLLAFLAFNWFRSPAVPLDQAHNSELTITPLTNAEIIDQARSLRTGNILPTLSTETIRVYGFRKWADRVG